MVLRGQRESVGPDCERDAACVSHQLASKGTGASTRRRAKNHACSGSAFGAWRSRIDDRRGGALKKSAVADRAVLGRARLLRQLVVDRYPVDMGLIEDVRLRRPVDRLEEEGAGDVQL